MATVPISRDEALEAARAFKATGSKMEAAASLGMARNKYNGRLKAAEKVFGFGKFFNTNDPKFALPDDIHTAHQTPSFPDDDLPAEDILDQHARRFEKRLAHHRSLKWFPIKMKVTEPIAVAWVGDPHLGSNGCNVPLLRRDCELLANTPGAYAVNMGDTADNWGGRLTRLYSENDVSRSTERRLARWFLKDAGLNWLVWLLGNHDDMDSAFSVYLKEIGGKEVPMVDWRAQFQIQFPNNATFRIDAAHNHKGHSMWNNLHGQERAAHMEEPADLYIAGHHHNWGVKQEEMPDGRVATLARARGYKWIDSHSARHQFHDHQLGASLVSVFNPLTEHPAKRHRIFVDIEDGLKYLAILRES